MTTPAKVSSANGRRDAAPEVDSASLEVERALRSSSHCGLRKVQCKFSDGNATLSGEVMSYYLKQIAQTVVGRLPQVTHVNNQLRVVEFDNPQVDP